MQSAKFKVSVIFFFALIGLLLFSPTETFAAKARVWNTGSTAVVTTTRPTFSVKLRADRRAVNINFYSLNTANSVSYELTYVGITSANEELDQGVTGSINQNEGNSAFRLLLFGTCSKTVCTYHRNVHDTQLTITSKLKSGKTLIKKYKIKV